LFNPIIFIVMHTIYFFQRIVKTWMGPLDVFFRASGHDVMEVSASCMFDIPPVTENLGNACIIFVNFFESSN
jgi:hypothetical protein